MGKKCEKIEWILIRMNCVKACVENVENSMEYCCACKVSLRICNNKGEDKNLDWNYEYSRKVEKYRTNKREKIFDRFYYSFTFLFLFQIFFYFFIFFFFFFIVENWYWHTYGFIYIESFLLNFKIKIVDWFFYFKVIEMGSFWYVSILSTSQLQCIGFSRRL